jgi:GST-like protein
MASYPWIVPYARQGQNLGDFPNLERWFRAIASRPATVRAYELGEWYRAREATMDEDAKKVMFGQTAASIRR